MTSRRTTPVERAVERAGRERDAEPSAPATRRRHGVVHTPPELARHAVRAADDVLRVELGRTGGVSDPAVVLVDPACGPGAFFAAALAVAGRRRSQPAVCLGIDRDPRALDAARAVLDRAAMRAGWRLELRCADTLSSLEPLDPAARPCDGTWVVIGNPPWATCAERGSAGAVAPLLGDFRREAGGEPLRERRIGVLADDYVHFWRWAAEVARHAPGGAVVTLVTNGSFLDGPAHRGMRAALMRWFAGIEVLDLGGSALIARGGGRDDNLFGVRPSVALTVAWRPASFAEPRRPVAVVDFASVRGARDDKLAWLHDHRRAEAGYRRVEVDPPLFLWSCRPRRAPPLESVSLAQAIPFHREGVQTNRDGVAVDRDREALLERLRAFARGSTRGDLAPALRAVTHYDPVRSRRRVREALAADPEGRLGLSVRRLAYRPYDDRWFVPVAPLCHRPRPDLLAAMDRSDFALLTVRKDRGERSWAHVGASRWVADNCWLSSRSSCRTRLFPTHGSDGTDNLDPVVKAQWSDRVGSDVNASQVLRYALAILCADSYRRRWDALLRTDYPWIPVPPDPESWRRLTSAGERIRAAFCDLREETAAERPRAITVGHVHLSPAPLALVDALEDAEHAFVRAWR